MKQCLGRNCQEIDCYHTPKEVAKHNEIIAAMLTQAYFSDSTNKDRRIHSVTDVYSDLLRDLNTGEIGA